MAFKGFVNGYPIRQYATKVRRRLDWLQEAECAKRAREIVHEDPEIQRNLRNKFHEMFFKDNNWCIENAKKVCDACPVKNACLIDAIETNAPGVRGGMSSKTRRRKFRHLNVVALSQEEREELWRGSKQNSQSEAS